MNNIIEVKDLYKAFDDLEILKGVDMHLGQGENLGILGKSGMGKSVLTKCIVRLLEPDYGIVRVLGKDILAMNDSELNKIREKIGYLFQGGALYDSMSVRENLEFPIRRTQMSNNKAEVDEMIERALNSVGLLDAIDKIPSELSGGMKKRIGLARALILKPKVILYDEPTTGLDSVTAGEISELIVRVQKEYQAASIIVTHDMKCAQITTNRIQILDEGNFIAEGTYNELSKSSEPKVKAFFS
ncbi:MAG: ABC transporter ATP-binding protein [Paludibacteraceae bacterium]